MWNLPQSGLGEEEHNRHDEEDCVDAAPAAVVVVVVIASATIVVVLVPDAHICSFSFLCQIGHYRNLLLAFNRFADGKCEFA